MISFFEAALQTLSVHRVGNKLMDEYYSLSGQPLQLDDESKLILMNYFLSPFQKVNEVYRLLNAAGGFDVFHSILKTVFNEPDCFHEASEAITRKLFDVTNHPKIKAGDLYVAHFHNVQIEGELVDAIGIFKSETKETFLKVNRPVTTPDVDLIFERDAVNLNKLDKGCLIFNIEAEKGFKVAVIDNSSSFDAGYWKDEFLGLMVRNDEYTQTNNILHVCHNFITDTIDSDFEVSSAAKADLLNKSIKYFKEKEAFDLEEFTAEVFENNTDAMELFKKTKEAFESDFETAIPESFNISAPAVKKQAKNFKKILKLDKNFHIYIHGNKELIEKGFDDDKSLNYYKVYFKEEA